jgi:small redox-active disulfide protein 2
MIMEIKVLGPGCPKCKSLEKLVQETVQEMQLDATVTKVEDIMEIMQYNIIATPALVINGKVVLKGVLPSKMQLQTILSKN